MLEIHNIYCRRFLSQFEAAQEKMLCLKNIDAARELELLYNCFYTECKKGASRFQIQLKNKKENLLISGQLKNICSLIEHFSGYTEKIMQNKLTPQEIILHFEEQHQFKKILLRHLNDLDRIKLI